MLTSQVCINDVAVAFVGFHGCCHNPVVKKPVSRWQCRVCTYRQTTGPVSNA